MNHPTNITAAKENTAKRYWIVAKTGSETEIPLDLSMSTIFSTKKKSFLKYKTTLPQIHGPIIAAARPDRE